MKLSVAIITYNEERNIERCLKSVKDWVSEIVVVDSFSTDRTEEICNRYGARFMTHPFEGHIQQKNFALSQCLGDWILSLDADEAPDNELAQHILHAITESSFGGYRMNRLTNYCGKWVRHCGWYPDAKLRLVRNGWAHWKGLNPHDRLELDKEHASGWLKGNILHFSYYTREDHYRQIEYFGDIAAKALYGQGKRIAMPMVYVKVIVQFIKSFLIKSGWRDGKTGWHISVRSAFATWRKYQKLRALWRNG
jgi:glycosyltransferase involved in cell wall biosynthesis